MKNAAKLLLVLVQAYAVMGCADPKYLPTENSQAVKTKTVSGYDCSLKFKKFDLCLGYTWQKLPTDEEPGTMTIRLFELDPADGFPLLKNPPQTLFVKLWMPDMGHGSSPVQLTHVSAGTYHAKNIFFTMPGAWWIQFQIREGSEVSDEIRVDYRH